MRKVIIFSIGFVGAVVVLLLLYSGHLYRCRDIIVIHVSQRRKAIKSEPRRPVRRPSRQTPALGNKQAQAETPRLNVLVHRSPVPDDSLEDQKTRDQSAVKRVASITVLQVKVDVGKSHAVSDTSQEKREPEETKATTQGVHRSVPLPDDPEAAMEVHREEFREWAQKRMKERSLQ